MATYGVQQDLNTNLLMPPVSRTYHVLGLVITKVYEIHKYLFHLHCSNVDVSKLHILHPQEKSTTHDQCNFSCHAIQLCDEKYS